MPNEKASIKIEAIMPHELEFPPPLKLRRTRKIKNRAMAMTPKNKTIKTFINTKERRSTPNTKPKQTA
jgi:hypothetical protein